MRIKGLTENEILTVFKRVNKKYKTNLKPYPGAWGCSNYDALSRRGNYISFCLRLDNCKDSFHRRAHYKGNRMNCVCWHGHKEFMLGVFEINPDAIIKTSFASYKGKHDFLMKYEETGERNAGSQIHPVEFQNLCDCNSENGELAFIPFIKL